jgi:hypothetical protein
MEKRIWAVAVVLEEQHDGAVVAAVTFSDGTNLVDYMKPGRWTDFSGLFLEATSMVDTILWSALRDALDRASNPVGGSAV